VHRIRRQQHAFAIMKACGAAFVIGHIGIYGRTRSMGLRCQRWG
jgi:hypothetical protein